jgi:hypothetical protein
VKNKATFAKQEEARMAPADAKSRLTNLLAQGRNHLAKRPLREGILEIWSSECRKIIKSAFGDQSAQSSLFTGQLQVRFSMGPERYDQYAEMRDAETLERRCDALDVIISQIDDQVSPEITVPHDDSFWNDLHPLVARVAKPRFDHEQFADAVEAASPEESEFSR